MNEGVSERVSVSVIIFLLILLFKTAPKLGLSSVIGNVCLCVCVSVTTFPMFHLFSSNLSNPSSGGGIDSDLYSSNPLGTSISEVQRIKVKVPGLCGGWAHHGVQRIKVKVPWEYLPKQRPDDSSCTRGVF